MATHACTHCAPLAPLILTGHAAMMVGERKAWLPFALVMSQSLIRHALLAAGNITDVTAIGVLRFLLSLSILTFFRNISSGSVFPRGAASAQPQPQSNT